MRFSKRSDSEWTSASHDFVVVLVMESIKGVPFDAGVCNAHLHHIKHWSLVLTQFSLWLCCCSTPAYITVRCRSSDSQILYQQPHDGKWFSSPAKLQMSLLKWSDVWAVLVKAYILHGKYIAHLHESWIHAASIPQGMEESSECTENAATMRVLAQVHFVVICLDAPICKKIKVHLLTLLKV